jgi:hypothetical protein
MSIRQLTPTRAHDQAHRHELCVRAALADPASSDPVDPEDLLAVVVDDLVCNPTESGSREAAWDSRVQR